MVILNLEPDQVGKQLITLSPAQLVSIRLQEAGNQVPPVTQPPAGNGGARTFALSNLSVEDKKWLRIAMDQYRVALRNKPGAHQLCEDMLVDSRGFNVTDHAPNDALQARINQLKNEILAGGALYDPAYGVVQAAQYAGPLKQIYANLVAFKLQ